MVAKKLLVNSITKVEEGEKQKKEKPKNRQSLGRRQSASCTLSCTNYPGEVIWMLLEVLHAVFEPGEESDLISGHLNLGT